MTSVKSEKNRLTNVETINVGIQKTFLKPANIRLLIRRVYTRHRQEGGESQFTDVKRDVPDMARKWAVRELLDWYSSHNPADWDHVIQFVNDKFVTAHYQEFRIALSHRGSSAAEWDTGNLPNDNNGRYDPIDVDVFHQSARVGSISEFGNESEQRRYQDMGVDDIRSLDVWQEQRSDISNSNFRRKNKMQIWQKAGLVRHYDRNNEGLRDRNWQTASRPVPIRGYDMSGIHVTPKHVDLEWDQL